MNIETPLYLFFDYDQTVCVNHRISRKTREALLSVQKKGNKLILCTGRSKGHVPNLPDILSIPWDGMIYAGADIYYEGRCLEEHISPPKALFEWCDYAMRHGYDYILEGQKQVFIFPFSKGENISAEEYADFYHQEGGIQSLNDWIDICRHTIENEPITKITVITDNPCMEDIPTGKMKYVVHGHYTEAFAPGCDKGVAIKHFCEHIGTSLEQCVCFGDSMNDYSMFCVCPIGISMKWAPQDLVEVSAYQAKTDEGVAEGLEWLFSSEAEGD